MTRMDETALKRILLEQKMREGMTLQQAHAALENDPRYGPLFKGPDKETKPKGSKMRNEITSVDGMRFDSKKEAEFYNQLKLRLRARDIKAFARQVPFILNEAEHGNRPVMLKVDFVVWELDGRVRIIDIKPAENFLTKEYKTKKRLFESMSGLKIEEIYEV